MQQTVVVLFNLKQGVTPDDYEQWARGTDLPIVNALPSVKSFEVFRATGLLGGGSAPYQYVEILRFSSMDALFADIGTEKMQGIAAQFQAFADSPLFITTSVL